MTTDDALRGGSACRKICKQNKTVGYCSGCGRRPIEIITWSRMTAEDKAVITSELPARLAALEGMIDAASP